MFGSHIFWFAFWMEAHIEGHGGIASACSMRWIFCARVCAGAAEHRIVQPIAVPEGCILYGTSAALEVEDAQKAAGGFTEQADEKGPVGTSIGVR